MPRRRPRTAQSDEEVILIDPDSAEDLTEPIAGDAMVVPKEAPVVEPEPEVVQEPVQAAPKRSRAVKTKDAGIVETKEQPQPEAPVARREGEPNGIIIGPGDPVKIEGDDLGQEILVTQDVYRMVFPNGARRPSYILLYPRGTKVLKSTLQKL